MKTLKFLIVFCFIQCMSYSQIIISTIGLTGGCSGSCQGTANFSVTGGLAPYSYNIVPSMGGVLPDPATGVYFYNLCPGGQYTLTVIDQNSIAATSIFSLTESTFVPVVTTTNSNCSGTCVGAININPIGGTPPYGYSWITSMPNPVSMPMTNLCSDVYSIYAGDSNGCGMTLSIPVMSNPTISGVNANTNSFDATCLNSMDGGIDLNISGSNPGPFTYQWSYGSTTQNLNPIFPGIYMVTIYDASMNCMSLIDTVGSVNGNCGSISGNIFIDNNSDCIKNAGDVDCWSAGLTINPGNYIGYVNLIGNYWVGNIPYGTYTITPNNYSNSFLGTCVTTLTATINATNLSSLYNDFSFGYTSLTQPDVQVSAYTNGIVPGFNCFIKYTLCNLNNVSVDGIYKAVLPTAFISGILSVAPATYTISGDTIMWNYSNLLSTGGCQEFQINFIVPVNTPLGSTFTTCMYVITTIPDFDITNNQYCYDRIVTGAFDPNDKSVSPLGDGPNGNITVNDKELTYLVRFQNTGNGPANTVIVKDSISPFLDMTTFQMISASHNYDIEIGAGNIIKWNFNSIMLPDSASDEPGSHGYIHYKIKQKANNPIGSKIKNTAYIYFDFNEAVVTNSTLNTIVAPTGIEDITKANDTWRLFPNPSNGLVYLENNSKEERGKFDIQVLNSMGQMIYKEVVEANNKILDLNKYSSGVYFVRIVSDKQTVIKRFVLNK